MTRASHHHDPSGPLPAVDEHLVMPGSGFEILDGKVFEVPPAEEPHAERNSKLAALLEAHVHDDFNVAVDMLTRTDRLNEFAPDASVYPVARHPETGGRQLEQLAFEIVSTETLGHAALKAAKLLERGVRRVFALDVEGRRVLEWSSQQSAWERVALGDSLDDPCLAVPLPVAALVMNAKADDAVAEALLGKGNRVLRNALKETSTRAETRGKTAGLQEGLKEGQQELERQARENQQALERQARESQRALERQARESQQALEQQARGAIADLCEVLGVELTEARQADLAGRDLAGLSALRQHLKAHRSWP